MENTGYEFTMVIPSYWGKKNKNEETIFDHPTKLHQKGTLDRLLNSLNIFNNLKGNIVVLSVANNSKIYDDVKSKVNQIITPYKNKFDITNFGQRELEELRGKLNENGVSQEALNLVNLNNYSNVRNICSLIGIMNKSEYTIFIDDDEVFTDPNFLNKVNKDMNTSISGKKIKALAGYYLQPDTYKLDDTKTPGWRKQFWDNATTMNKAFDLIIGQEPQIKPTPFVFGGNMILSKEILSKVPFDPKITRGEDIDFLINSKIQESVFYLDNKLSIVHLPPNSTQEPWKKLKEDALRFLYEKQKIQDHISEINLNELQPYPGRFLDSDLEEKIINTSNLLKKEYESKGDSARAEECKKIIEITNENPYKKIDTKVWLKKITKDWQKITQTLEKIV